VVTRDGDEGSGQREHPAGPCGLGWSEGEGVAAVAAAQELPADPEGGGVEVDVVPPQAEYLALAQAEGQAEHPAGAQPVARGGVEQAVGFLDRERLDLVVGCFGWFDHQGDVARHASPFHRDFSARRIWACR
jgi:hypothetical protein